MDRNGELSREEWQKHVPPLWVQSTNLLKHMGGPFRLKRGAAPWTELNRDVRRPAVMDDKAIRPFRFVERNQIVRALEWVRMLIANVVSPVGHRFAAMSCHAL